MKIRLVFSKLVEKHTFLLGAVLCSALSYYLFPTFFLMQITPMLADPGVLLDPSASYMVLGPALSTLQY